MKNTAPRCYSRPLHSGRPSFLRNLILLEGSRVRNAPPDQGTTLGGRPRGWWNWNTRRALDERSCATNRWDNAAEKKSARPRRTWYYLYKNQTALIAKPLSWLRDEHCRSVYGKWKSADGRKGMHIYMHRNRGNLIYIQIEHHNIMILHDNYCRYLYVR